MYTSEHNICMYTGVTDGLYEDESESIVSSRSHRYCLNHHLSSLARVTSRSLPPSRPQ